MMTYLGLTRTICLALVVVTTSLTDDISKSQVPNPNPKMGRQRGDCRGEIDLTLRESFPGYRVVSPGDLQSDLRDCLEKSHIYADPGCLRANFNGDGTMDYALLLTKKDQRSRSELVVVLLGRKDASFCSLTLNEFDSVAGDLSLRYVPPGGIQKWGSDRKVLLRYPGIGLSSCEVDWGIYFWNGEHFDYAQTSYAAVGPYVPFSDSTSRNLGCEQRVGETIRNRFPRCRVVQTRDLDQDLQEYLSERPGGFPPGCLSADFDGDGRTDYALLLTSAAGKTGSQLLVALRAGKDGSLTPDTLETLGEGAGRFYIRQVPPGTIRQWDNRRTVHLKHAAIMIELFESASRVYYWSGHRFQYMQTSE